MKILVSGKGGCGKSTLTVLLANGFQRMDFRVLIVDTDESNLGLEKMVGVKLQKTLMLHHGGKKAYKKKLSDPFLSHKIGLDEIPGECTSHKDKLTLLAIGKINDYGEGCACSLGVLAKRFLSDLVLNEKEVVIIDTEAGLEHFGRQIAGACDIVISVVEPSYESIQLSKKIAEMAKTAGKKCVFIINRFHQDLESVVASQLPADAIIGQIPDFKEISSANLKGDPLDFVPKEAQAICNRLIEFSRLN